MTRESLFKTLETLSGPNANTQIQSPQLHYTIKTAQFPQTALEFCQTQTEALNLIGEHKDCISGKIKNQTENRPVQHHQLREPKHRKTHYPDTLKNVLSSLPKSITHVLQIGIGGSHLGPEFLYNAISRHHRQVKKPPLRKALFLSHVDPLQFQELTQHISPKNTFVIIASKSGKTSETESNLRLLTQWWQSQNESAESLTQQSLILTTKNSPLDQQRTNQKIVYFNDSIGGRFSASSLVSTSLLTACFGPDIVTEFLDAAHHMDQHCQNPDITQNMALLAAWITIWNRNCNHYPVTACVPYSYAFQSLFPFIQQLECESNGKTINRNNKKLTYKTAPALISELGTNCQHSFFQMIHQGSDIIPVEFIGIQDQNKEKMSCLNAHLYGQIAALSNGEENTDPHKAITANKPSTLLLAKDCSPKTCGELIAFYENKVMFEGFIWDINSFDQFGVEAGKQNALNYLLKT